MAEEEQFLWHNVTTNIVRNKLSVPTKYARKRILKYVKLHRDRSVGELYARSIYERYSIYKMNVSEFSIGKYAIAISTELSYVTRKKDFCEFHHVFRRDRESNQARTDRMSRTVRLFLCYARMHVPCILKSSTNTMYRYVNVSKHEHRSKLLYN